jgi:fluoride exporter
MKFILLGAFGILGVFCRYFVGLVSLRIFPVELPYGTFIINIAGCLLIGVVYALGVERAAIPHDLRLALMVGFLGGFTTFSSYGLETLLLIRDDKVAAAMAYLFLSPVLGLAACWGGFELASLVAK